MNRDKLQSQLEAHEGKELRAYLYPSGHFVVGVGRDLEANPANGELGRKIDSAGMQISDEEAMRLLDHDIDRFASQLRINIPKFDLLSEPRQHVLIDMALNLGTKGLLQFKRMLAAIRESDFHREAKEMLDYRWATQVMARALRLARMMRENKPFEEVVPHG